MDERIGIEFIDLDRILKNQTHDSTQGGSLGSDEISESLNESEEEEDERDTE